MVGSVGRMDQQASEVLANKFDLAVHQKKKQKLLIKKTKITCILHHKKDPLYFRKELKPVCCFSQPLWIPLPSVFGQSAMASAVTADLFQVASISPQ